MNHHNADGGENTMLSNIVKPTILIAPDLAIDFGKWLTNIVAKTNVVDITMQKTTGILLQKLKPMTMI